MPKRIDDLKDQEHNLKHILSNKIKNDIRSAVSNWFDLYDELTDQFGYEIDWGKVKIHLKEEEGK